MVRHRPRTGPAPSLGALSSLANLEPYAVGGALLAGFASWVGLEHGTVPSLVLVCWFLFLADRRAPTRGGFPTSDHRSFLEWGIATSTTAVGWALEIGPWLGARLPLGIGAPGSSELLLAVLAALAPFLVLPPAAARTRDLPRSWRWVARA